MNYVTVSRPERNPTIKDEIRQRSSGRRQSTRAKRESRGCLIQPEFRIAVARRVLRRLRRRLQEQ